MCFESAEALAERPRLADAVINGTMDTQHVKTAVPLLRRGYDMLLEKPFAVNEDEMWELQRVVGETGRRVMICHVLRYAPFYVAVKERLLAGEIRRYHQHPGHRARQLSSPGGVLYPRQMGQRGKVRRAHAAGQMLPRHGPHHVAEKRCRPPAGRQLRQRLSVRPGQEARRRGKRVPGGLRHRGKLPVLRPKSITSTIRTAGAFMCGTAWSIWKSPPLRTRSSR